MANPGVRLLYFGYSTEASQDNKGLTIIGSKKALILDIGSASTPSYPNTALHLSSINKCSLQSSASADGNDTRNQLLTTSHYAALMNIQPLGN